MDFIVWSLAEFSNKSKDKNQINIRIAKSW